jgi:hypothetical protein
MIDEIPDTSFDETITAEEQAAFDEMRGGEVAPVEKPAAEPAEKAEAKTEAEKPEAEAPKDEVKDGEEKVTYVRQEALHEERQRRKELERQLREIREAQVRQDGMLQALKPNGQAQQGPKPASQWTAEEIKANPVEYLTAQAEERAVESQRTEQERAFQSQAKQVADIGIRHSQEFVKTTPHFFDTKGDDGATVPGAYSFLRQKAAERIAEDFPDATPDQIQATLNLHELNLIQEAVRDGKNSAALVYELAIAQGYQPPKPKTAPAAPMAEAEKIAKAEAAQRGGKSLGAMPAGGNAGELSIEALADMSEEEFAEATKGKKWEKLQRAGVLGR